MHDEDLYKIDRAVPEIFAKSSNLKIAAKFLGKHCRRFYFFSSSKPENQQDFREVKQEDQGTFWQYFQIIV